MDISYLMHSPAANSTPSSSSTLHSRERRSGTARGRSDAGPHRQLDGPSVSSRMRMDTLVHAGGSSPSVRPQESHGHAASPSDYTWDKVPGSGPTTKSKQHTCFCGRVFNKREHLKRHNLLVHQEVRPFTCTICDAHFGTKQNMQVHLTTRKHRQRVAFLGPEKPSSQHPSEPSHAQDKKSQRN